MFPVWPKLLTNDFSANSDNYRVAIERGGAFTDNTVGARREINKKAGSIEPAFK